MASPKTTDNSKAAAKPKETESEKARKRRQYVSPHPDGGWQVKPEGASKATKRFKTKAEAEEYAKELSKKQGVGMVRQKKDGKIQKKR